MMVSSGLYEEWLREDEEARRIRREMPTESLLIVSLHVSGLLCCIINITVST